MNSRISIRYYYQDEFEQKIADESTKWSASRYLTGVSMLGIQRELFFRYKTSEELESVLQRKFIGKSIYVESVRDFCGRNPTHHIRWNGDWSSSKRMNIRNNTVFPVTACSSIEVFSVLDILEKYEERPSGADKILNNRMSTIDSYFFTSWEAVPGLEVPHTSYYRWQSPEQKTKFWGEYLSGVKDWEYLEILTKTARFAMVHEPELERYVPVDRDKVHEIIIRMIQESGALNRNELLGRVMSRSNQFGFSMGDYDREQRIQFIHAFYTIITDRYFEFYRKFQNRVDHEYGHNYIPRVHAL